jgi:TonB family protein
MKKVFRTTFNPVPSIRQSFLQIQKGQVEVVLGVTVDKSGKLADLMVLRSSGLTAYDQEALRTIRDSAPFAAPPPELLNAPGALRMAWTFTVYL